jgi:hypothetical protein
MRAIIAASIAIKIGVGISRNMRCSRVEPLETTSVVSPRAGPGRIFSADLDAQRAAEPDDELAEDDKIEPVEAIEKPAPEPECANPVLARAYPRARRGATSPLIFTQSGSTLLLPRPLGRNAIGGPAVLIASHWSAGLPRGSILHPAVIAHRGQPANETPSFHQGSSFVVRCQKGRR